MQILGSNFNKFLESVFFILWIFISSLLSSHLELYMKAILFLFWNILFPFKGCPEERGVSFCGDHHRLLYQEVYGPQRQVRSNAAILRGDWWPGACGLHPWGDREASILGRRRGVCGEEGRWRRGGIGGEGGGSCSPTIGQSVPPAFWHRFGFSKFVSCVYFRETCLF